MREAPKERSTAIGKARRMQRRQDVSLTPGFYALAGAEDRSRIGSRLFARVVHSIYGAKP
jgi:hypothetical protein